MDIRRTVIFIGLAITSYFLILAWSNDYSQKPQTSTPVAVDSNTVDTVFDDIPDTSDAHNAQPNVSRSEEHTSELQSRPHLVCRLLLEKKKKNTNTTI